jgi:hypothetical protein
MPTLEEFYTIFPDLSGTVGAINGITGIAINIQGIHNDIDPGNLTNIEITCSGNVINETLTFSHADYIENNLGVLGNDVTVLHFYFENELTDPGIYRLNMQWLTERSMKTITLEGNVDRPIFAAPADPDNLTDVALHGTGIYNTDFTVDVIDAIGFSFSLSQNSFNISDLHDLTLTRDGEPVPFETWDFVIRTYNYNII